MKTCARLMIRVLLADDHALVRKGIRSLLEDMCPHIRVVDEASDGEEALRKAKDHAPDIALLDLSMPKMSGPQVAARLLQEVPKTRAIIVSMHEEREYLHMVVRSGAKGYVLKHAHPEELIEAIDAVHRGETFFSPAVSKSILHDVVEGGGQIDNPLCTRLTQRENEVLALVAGGRSNKEIAERLGIGVRTVEAHREHLLLKLDLHNAVELTKYALRRGIVQLAEPASVADPK